MASGCFWSSQEHNVPLMILMKYLVMFSFWIAVAAYCVPAIVAGPSGILEMRRAASSADAMRENLDRLTDMNTMYALELDQLHSLHESTALEARSLGYIADNEIVVRMPTSSLESLPSPNPGHLVIYLKEPALRDIGIKRLSILLTAFASVAILVMKLLLADKWRTDHRASLTQEASRT
jgi:cell division protein FtsB